MSFSVSPVMQVGKGNPIQGQRAPIRNTDGKHAERASMSDNHRGGCTCLFGLVRICSPAKKSVFVLLLPLFNSKAMKSKKPDLWSFLQLGFSAPLPFSRINHSLEPTSSLKWEALTFLLPFMHPLIRRSPPLPPTRTLLRVLRALALPFCSSASHLSLSSPISAHPFPSPRLAIKGIVSLSFHCVAHNDVIARKIQRFFTPHRTRGEIRELIIARSPLSLT